jgi:hypothetical protein
MPILLLQVEHGTKQADCWINASVSQKEKVKKFNESGCLFAFRNNTHAV